jgi:hypothetical protein
VVEQHGGPKVRDGLTLVSGLHVRLSLMSGAYMRGGVLEEGRKRPDVIGADSA